jgi:hypothetical protein
LTIPFEDVSIKLQGKFRQEFSISEKSLNYPMRITTWSGFKKPDGAFFYAQIFPNIKIPKPVPLYPNTILEPSYENTPSRRKHLHAGTALLYSMFPFLPDF